MAKDVVRGCSGPEVGQKKSVSIETLLGIALGRVGLRLADFEALTPDELDEVLKQYTEQEEARQRSGWEQARMIAFSAVAPHSKRIRRPTDLLKFDWDGKPIRKEEEERMTLEERRKLMDELSEMWKDD